ncbi:hypothetical protein GCM10007916_37720 [Psychromonas marina]|uniref:Uncharacterized protein n=1 Tax=Psychromonas marina TaxID=88364 RepID=A0ABQ6E6C6_9GAMM|nr:hypothetical protein GCM10007916_37720 [Psychromonas marina]
MIETNLHRVKTAQTTQVWASLALKLATGQPSRLTNEQLSQLKNFVVSSAVKADGGRLQGNDVQRYVLAEFGVQFENSIFTTYYTN